MGGLRCQRVTSHYHASAASLKRINFSLFSLATFLHRAGSSVLLENFFALNSSSLVMAFSHPGCLRGYPRFKPVE